MTRLAAIEYQLDEHELPEHRSATGALDIELDHVDGQPYIWACQVRIYDCVTHRIVEYDYTQGSKDNYLPAVELVKELHRDKQLMDRIYDECAYQAS